jgi:transcriptional regulator with XRE-family HTH domain
MAMPSPNDQLAAQGAWLRRQLAERGWTAEDLVQHAQAWAYRNHKGEIGMTRSYVSEWLSGKRGVSVRYAEILAGVLNVPASQFIDGRASQAGKLDDIGTRRDFLRAAADAAVLAGVSPLIETLEASQDDLARVLGTARLGQRRLERLEHAAERYARLYSSSSPAAVGPGIRDHFRAISAALEQSQPAEHQRRMLVVCGRLAGLMSWLCYDINRQALSLDYLDQGIEAAEQANDPVLGAYLRASANRVASFEGDHREIRDLGLAAGRSDVSARMLAWFHALVARGRSGTSDLSGTEKALSAAARALGAQGRPPHGPELAFFDDTRLVALG